MFISKEKKNLDGIRINNKKKENQQWQRSLEKFVNIIRGKVIKAKPQKKLQYYNFLLNAFGG